MKRALPWIAAVLAFIFITPVAMFCGVLGGCLIMMSGPSKLSGLGMTLGAWAGFVGAIFIAYNVYRSTASR